jgi:hypothetical protein
MSGSERQTTVQSDTELESPPPDGFSSSNSKQSPKPSSVTPPKATSDGSERIKDDPIQRPPSECSFQETQWIRLQSEDKPGNHKAANKTSGGENTNKTTNSKITPKGSNKSTDKATMSESQESAVVTKGSVDSNRSADTGSRRIRARSNTPNNDETKREKEPWARVTLGLHVLACILGCVVLVLSVANCAMSHGGVRLRVLIACCINVLLQLLLTVTTTMVIDYCGVHTRMRDGQRAWHMFALAQSSQVLCIAVLLLCVSLYIYSLAINSPHVWINIMSVCVTLLAAATHGSSLAFSHYMEIKTKTTT